MAGDLSQREAEVLLTLDRSFQPVALLLRTKCHENGLAVAFESGYRPFGFQKLLYEHPEFHPGTPAAKPGESKHERGFAVDFDLTKLSRLDVVKFAMLAEGLGLIWGGRFQTDGQPTPDNGHVEAHWTNLELDNYRLIEALGT